MPKQRKALQLASRKVVLGNLSGGQGYADKRKKKFLHNYQKLRRKQRLQVRDQTGNFTASEQVEANTQEFAIHEHSTQTTASKVPSQGSNAGSGWDLGKEANRRLDPPVEWGKERNREKRMKNRFSRAQEEFVQKKTEKQLRLQASRRQKEERMQALGNYKQRKLERQTKLSKKTRRGQPVMKYQMEVLLDKIKTQSQR